ncbi:MAG: NAD(P)H-hydrate dehydratase [Candidatus Aenigmarchaeota archaeon]|nr:NAD(P)H-hydrate dehydratase [Candidatus Aenigmarchaeota archaeon]
MKNHLVETSAKLVKDFYKTRNKTAKKGDYGKLLVVGGSHIYTGSPALVSLAAYASGCDLVWNVAPERAADAMASFSPDIMTHPLKGDYLEKAHVKYILTLSERADAIVIGNGLGRDKDTTKAVLEIISRASKPIVVDADAIKALIPENHKVLRGKNAVLTPHSYEMQMFSCRDVGTELQSRVAVAKELSGSLGITIVLKGNVDVIASNGRVAINKTGNPYMTKGGTGDTLAGVCGSLLARGADSFSAAGAAAYINGLAGDLCAKYWGEGLTAYKMIDYIPKAIKAAL